MSKYKTGASRIWTRFLMTISNDANYYTTSNFIYIYIYGERERQKFSELGTNQLQFRRSGSSEYLIPIIKYFSLVHIMEHFLASFAMEKTNIYIYIYIAIHW